jgi:hypothetical protein
LTTTIELRGRSTSTGSSASTYSPGVMRSAGAR